MIDGGSSMVDVSGSMIDVGGSRMVGVGGFRMTWSDEGVGVVGGGRGGGTEVSLGDWNRRRRRIAGNQRSCSRSG